MKLRSFILALSLGGMGLVAALVVAAYTPSIADYADRYAPPFAILFFYLFGCLIAVARRLSRGRAVVYNCAFVFLALALAELYLLPARAADYEIVFKDLNSGKPIEYYHNPDSDLGYVNKPNMTVSAIKRSTKDGSILYDVKYSIDERGLRKTIPQNNNGVLFFGDSFIFGEGLNDEETMPQKFSRLSGWCALNFGVIGYGPHQMLRELEIGRPERLGISNPLAIVFTLHADHSISRAAGLAPWDHRGPRYELIDGALKYLGPFNETRSLFDRVMSKSAIYAAIFKKYPQLPDSENNRQRVLAMLLKAKDLAARKYHAPFMIILWDTYILPEGRSNAEWLARTLQENQIVTLQLSTAVPGLGKEDNYISADYHPNGKGNTLLARAVDSFLTPYLQDSSNNKPCGQRAP
jgi:hypothetical protein